MSSANFWFWEKLKKCVFLQFLIFFFSIFYKIEFFMICFYRTCLFIKKQYNFCIWHVYKFSVLEVIDSIKITGDRIEIMIVFKINRSGELFLLKCRTVFILLMRGGIAQHLLFFLYRFLLDSFSAFVLDSSPQFETNKLTN